MNNENINDSTSGHLFLIDFLIHNHGINVPLQIELIVGTSICFVTNKLINSQAKLTQKLVIPAFVCCTQYDETSVLTYILLMYSPFYKQAILLVKTPTQPSPLYPFP